MATRSVTVGKVANVGPGELAAFDIAMPLIKERAVVDSAELEDESVDLRNLLHAHIGKNQGGAST